MKANSAKSKFVMASFIEAADDFKGDRGTEGRILKAPSIMLIVSRDQAML